jgi:16S rRNA (adenine1518-N6/adenine1519-N6)-dimethyltransferase
VSRPPFEELRRRLEDVGFRPSKTLGQNFLVDPGLCRAVAEAAPPLEGQVVLEVGVGLGFLTAQLLERGARVLGVEIDGRLAALATELLAAPAELDLIV